jgi:site-specific DNA-cytosine methylase
MRYLSLFSGIGGFDYGLDQAGHVCVGHVENDPTCIRILERWWPDVPRYGDVKEFHGDELGPVDLVCGGFPCQDLSVAGRREGLAGERSGLWFDFHRILATSRPRWCLIENVPGLLSSNGGRDFAVLLRGLEGLGYHVAWRVLDAQFFGVPQRRDRVFIVGSLGDYSCVEILFESESLRGDSPPRRPSREDSARSVTPGSRKGSGQSTGGGAFTVEDPRGVDVRNLRYQPDDASGTLQSKKTGGYSLNYQNPVQVPPEVIAFTERTREEGARVEFQEDLAYALTNPGDGGRTDDRMIAVTDARGLGDGEVVPSLVGDHMNRVTDYTPIIALPDPAYAVQGVGSKFGSGRDAQDTFVVHPRQDPISSEDLSLPVEAKGPPAVAFHVSGYGGQVGDVAPPLQASDDRLSNQVEGVILPEPEVAGTVTGAEAHNGNSNPIADNLVFESRFARNDRGAPGPIVPPLKAQSGQSGKGDGAPLVFQQNQRDEVREMDVPGALASQPGMKQQNYVAQHIRHSGLVRRLTPVECERLQGFPDGWTERDKDGKHISDSARYRMLGNAVCTPVAAWLGRRFKEVEDG